MNRIKLMFIVLNHLAHYIPNRSTRNILLVIQKKCAVNQIKRGKR